MTYFFYDNFLAALCCVVPLLVILAFGGLFSARMTVDVYRRMLDTRLVNVRIGLNEFPISRQSLEAVSVAQHLLAQAIDTTKRRPFEEVQSLNLAPHFSTNNQAGTDMALKEAGDTLTALIGSTAAPATNGYNGYHGDDYDG